MKQMLSNALSGTAFYPTLKSAYRRLFKPEHGAARTYLSRFYGAMLKPGALVFDVGANRGDYAEVFLGLATTVVGVEPHPVCKHELLSLFGKNPKFILEPVALGPEVCDMELYLGEGGMDNVSTLSDEYRKTAVQLPGLAAAKLTNHITVQVDTLDRLIERHGVPDFCKIDVEGFELQVLSGLSKALPLVQFEYQPWLINLAVDCLNRLSALGDYEFNLTAAKGRDDQPSLAMSWMSKEALMTILRGRVASESLTGDLFARLKG
jgi:FkbM family methyltransferase